MKKLLPLMVALLPLSAGMEAAAAEKLLTDANPEVRLGAALVQAKANNPAAIPVLIDLLAVLPAHKRGPAEEDLRELAGEGAPAGPPVRDDRGAPPIHPPPRPPSC